jgi:hypothetical protein
MRRLLSQCFQYFLKHMKAQPHLHMLNTPVAIVWLVRDLPVWGRCARQCDASRGSDAIHSATATLQLSAHSPSSPDPLQPHDSISLFQYPVTLTCCVLHTETLRRKVATTSFPTRGPRHTEQSATVAICTHYIHTITQADDGAVTSARSSAREDRTRPQISRCPHTSKRRKKRHRIRVQSAISTRARVSV